MMGCCTLYWFTLSVCVCVIVSERTFDREKLVVCRPKAPQSAKATAHSPKVHKPWQQQPPSQPTSMKYGNHIKHMDVRLEWGQTGGSFLKSGQNDKQLKHNTHNIYPIYGSIETHLKCDNATFKYMEHTSSSDLSVILYICVILIVVFRLDV